MRKPERAIILAFAQQDCAACAALASEVLDAEIKKLPSIDVGEMRHYLKQLADRPEAWRVAFCALCVRLAQSDKVLHDAERNTLADIHRRLGVEVPKEFVGNRGK
jgi:bacterioferritin-associated ferredoxin